MINFEQHSNKNWWPPTENLFSSKCPTLFVDLLSKTVVIFYCVLDPTSVYIVPPYANTLQFFQILVTLDKGSIPKVPWIVYDIKGKCIINLVFVTCDLDNLIFNKEALIREPSMFPVHLRPQLWNAHGTSQTHSPSVPLVVKLRNHIWSFGFLSVNKAGEPTTTPSFARQKSCHILADFWWDFRNVLVTYNSYNLYFYHNFAVRLYTL